MEFQTKYQNRVSKHEINLGPKKVETAGYIPPKRQIEEMIMAGRRLNEAREDMYDFPDEKSIDPNFTDPTRDPGFEMADASRLAREAEHNLKRSKREHEEKLADEIAAKKAAQDAEKTEKTPE